MPEINIQDGYMQVDEVLAIKVTLDHLNEHMEFLHTPEFSNLWPLFLVLYYNHLTPKTSLWYAQESIIYNLTKTI